MIGESQLLIDDGILDLLLVFGIEGRQSGD